MARRLVAWLPFALLALVLLAWLWPLLLGGTLFWGLPALQFYPWRAFAFDELRAGRLPLWNPYNGGGAPLLANYQVAVLYPPNWLHMILPHVTAMNVLAVGHIVWAAVGMWRFAAAWKLPDLGRGVSMLAFALSGYLVGRLGSFPMTAAASWLPWLFLAAHRLVVAEHRARPAAIWALVVAMVLLAGHAQTAYYALLGAATYILWLGRQVQTGRARVVAWAWAVFGVGLGAGLAAAQLLPTLEFLSRSDRAAGLDYNWTANFSYSVARALTLLSPNLFGTPADGTYLTEGAYFEDAAYIGLLPLVGAAFAAVARLRNRGVAGRPAALDSVPFWLGMAGVAFLIALGKNGPVFPLLYRYVPTFKSFQGPVRWLILAVFALSMLAGVGVSYGWQKGKRTIFWSRLIVAGGVGMAAVAWLVAPRMLPADIPALPVMISGLSTSGLFISGCALLTLLQPAERDGRWYRWWQGIALAFVAFDLFWAFRGLNPTVPAAFFRPGVVEHESAALYMTAETEDRLKFEEFFPLNDYRVAVDRWLELRVSLLPNLNMLDRISMVNNFDPLVLQSYTDTVAALERSLPSGATVVEVADPPRQVPFGREAFFAGAVLSGLSILLGIGLYTGVFSRFSKPTNGTTIIGEP